MPNRIIKESVRTSPSLAALSDAAERLWHRLVTCVDDFGRYDGDPEVILAGCFGRRPKGWNAGKIERCLQELSTEPNPKDRTLLYRYDIKGRWYVEITKAELHLTRRAKVSKWPSRPTGANLLASANKCLQPRANAPLNESE